MSSHCNRYPSCGCGKYLGTKCQLPEGDPRLGQKEEDGIDPFDFKNPTDFDIEAWKRSFDGVNNPTKSSKRKYPSNYTPPKKKRK